jgi:hypothetical protein
MKTNELEVFHYKGYLCAIRENSIGYLCGYVFLPENHKFIKLDHESKWDVHGGITFTEFELDKRVRTPVPGLWIGFDCAHSGDLQSPEYVEEYPERVMGFVRDGGTYKDEFYVRFEIERLVEQLGTKPGRIVKEPSDFKLDLPL